MSPQDLITDSAIAAIVSDPRQVDNPIVDCNEAFVALTGYAREEVLGRNCRFLRGSHGESDHSARLRNAIRLRQPILVELTNYRKDGSAFRNAIMVAPIFDVNGEVNFFLGSQMAVAAGGVRQKLARSMVARLSARQREVLQAVARGRLNKQIAYDLGLTERTVKMHRAAALNNLNVKTVAEAIRIAIEAGF